jgi:hypothetical protein
MWRVCHEVIPAILQLYQGHVVTLLLQTMGLGMSMELKIGLSVDAPNALKVIR